MKVKFYATLRLKVGQSVVEATPPPGATVRHVLTDLTARYPVLKEWMWDENGCLAEHVHVLLNGRDVHYLNGLDTPVRPQDGVDIFPPVGGG
jgi:molybdopterin synthase sulfur carrier subunit